MRHTPATFLLGADGSEDARLAGLAAAKLSVKSGAEVHTGNGRVVRFTEAGYPG